MYQDLFPDLTRRRTRGATCAALMHSYRDLHRRFLSRTGPRSDQSTALAGLVLAIGDGMAVCLLVRPDEVDDDEVYRLLEYWCSC